MLKLRDQFPISLLFACLVGCFAFLLAGCDSSGSGMEEETGGSDQFDPQQAAETLESVDQAITSVREDTTIDPENRDLHEELTTVANAVVKVPGVESVEVPDDRLTATAILESGVTFVISNNRPPGVEVTEAKNEKSGSEKQPRASASEGRISPSKGDPQPETASSSERSGAKAIEEVQFPASKKAIVNAFDGGATQASQVQQYLSQAGYEVNGSLGAIGTNLLDMRDNYRNMGVLYLDTHGATFVEIGKVNGDIEPVGNRYALQTSTKVDLTTDWLGANKEDILNQRLVFGEWCVIGQTCAASDSVSGRDVSVAITDKFIDEYWSFAENGFAYIHACQIGGPIDGERGGAKAVRSAILDAGARAMIATEGYTATKILQESIYSTFEMALPVSRQEYGRPWSLGRVSEALQEKGLTSLDWYDSTDKMRTTNVQFYGSRFDATGLAPSIRRLEVVDDANNSQGRLRVHGHFPDTEGTLKIGETDLSVKEWNRDLIVAKLPFEGEASTGLVRAEHKEGIRGNAVTLTEWTGSMEAVLKGQGTLESRSTLDITFRGDVHPTRSSPTADPTLPETIEPYVSLASGGEVKGSGSYVDEDGNETIWKGENSYQIAGKSLVDPWYGSGPTGSTSGMRAGAARATSSATGPDYGPDNTFGGRMALRPKAGSGEMCLRIHGQWIVTSGGSSEEGKIRLPKFVLSAPNVSGGTLTEGSPPLGCVDVSFRDPPSNPTLTGGEFSFDPDQSSSSVQSIDVSWSSLQADPAPRSWSDDWF